MSKETHRRILRKSCAEVPFGRVICGWVELDAIYA